MIFEELSELMKSPNIESLSMSLDDCHIKGVFSLVVGGNENGKLTRVFIATKKIKPFDIQFHSHCYDLKIGVINGAFEHHLATNAKNSDMLNGDVIKLKEFEYKSPLNGGTGLSEVDDSYWKLASYKIPVGGEVYLTCEQVHSVSCGKGAIWVVQEQGFSQDSSIVLGTSFITDGLYNKPKQFQVNDAFQLVLDKLKRLVK